MTIDKLREILSCYPADSEVEIKDKYGYLIKTDNMLITTKIEDGKMSPIVINFDYD